MWLIKKSYDSSYGVNKKYFDTVQANLLIMWIKGIPSKTNPFGNHNHTKLVSR